VGVAWEADYVDQSSTLRHLLQNVRKRSASGAGVLFWPVCRLLASAAGHRNAPDRLGTILRVVVVVWRAKRSRGLG